MAIAKRVFGDYPNQRVEYTGTLDEILATAGPEGAFAIPDGLTTVLRYAGGTWSGGPISYDTLSSLLSTAPQPGMRATASDAPGSMLFEVGGKWGGSLGSVSQATLDALTAGELAQMPDVNGIGMHLEPKPWFFAHRGLYNAGVENTIKSFDLVIEAGAKFIEMDVTRISDGTLVVMHDDTTARTTTTSSNVIDHDCISWGKLVISNNKFGTIAPPTFDDILERYGNRVGIIPECKSGAGVAQAILQKLIQYKISKDFVIVQSFDLADLSVFVQHGYTALYLTGAVNQQNISDCVSNGIEWLGVRSTSTPENIQSAVSSGIKVAVWTLTGRSEISEMVANGCSAVFTNEEGYSSSRTRRVIDPFRVGSYGHIASVGMPYASISSGALNISNSDQMYRGFVQGWCAPLPDVVDITFSVLYADYVNNTRWMSLFFSVDDKDNFTDSAIDTANGYHILFRASGVLEVYRKLPGQAATKIGTTSGTEIPKGGSGTFTVSITANAITVTRNDAATTLTVSRPDSISLPYVRFGANGSSVSISAVSVSA